MEPRRSGAKQTVEKLCYPQAGRRCGRCPAPCGAPRAHERARRAGCGGFRAGRQGAGTTKDEAKSDLAARRTAGRLVASMVGRGSRGKGNLRLFVRVYTRASFARRALTNDGLPFRGAGPAARGVAGGSAEGLPARGRELPLPAAGTPALRQLPQALQLHPDRQGDAAAFQRVQAAWEALRDPLARAEREAVAGSRRLAAPCQELDLDDLPHPVFDAVTGAPGAATVSFGS